jgi:lipoprotein-anchoring transpeptidase ErfK/SrfK
MSPESRPPAISPRRLLAAAAATLVPLIPIVIALSLGAGGASAGGTTTASTLRFTPVGVLQKAPQNLLLPPGTGALVALVQQPTQMRSSPGGRVLAAVPLKTQFDSPDAMWVVRLSGPWLGVVSQLAGNNRVGWIPAASASLSRIDWEVRVSLSQRQLTVLHAGRPVERYQVAIGTPDAPTPTGRFAVTDRLATGDPSGPYGCCILALSAQAPHTIQGWNGGNRIAIHSTPETWTIGQAASHGCIRLTLPEGQWLLDHIPIGTPTLISSA